MELKNIEEIPKDKWVLGVGKNHKLALAVKLHTIHPPAKLKDFDGYIVPEETIFYFADILNDFTNPVSPITFKEAISEMILGNGVGSKDENCMIVYYYRDIKMFINKFKEEDKFITMEE